MSGAPLMRVLAALALVPWMLVAVVLPGGRERRAPAGSAATFTDSPEPSRV
jgi:hypothetical protein